MKLSGFLHKYGNFDFTEFPFNEVDSVIFSILAYLKWDRFSPSIEESKDSVLISSVSSKEDIQELISTIPFKEMNEKFYRLIISSKRYQEVTVNYFSLSFAKDNPEQFGAVTFFLPDGTGVVSYRGTDATYIGWREDFNMVLFDVVPSQKNALVYLDYVATLFSAPFYITGHSKGGNLALYAATHTNMENKSRLIMARSHDGPGFRDVDSHIDALIPILKKVSSTMPESSIVGALLGFRRNTKIIASKGI